MSALSPRAGFRTVARAAEAEREIKKSRFIGAVSPVDTEAAAREFIASRRGSHHAARHHCTAYVLGAPAAIQRSSDDGEPAGTGGVPILEVITAGGLTDVVVVVTRYFGGVLLGAGGLIRAYSSAAADAVAAAGLVERVPAVCLTISVEHTLAGRLDNELRSAGHDISGARYDVAAHFDLTVADADRGPFETWLAERTGGRARITDGEPTYLARPIR